MGRLHSRDAEPDRRQFDGTRVALHPYARADALTRCAHGANPQLAGPPSLPGNGAPSMLQTPRSIASPFESSVKWIYRDARGVR